MNKPLILGLTALGGLAAGLVFVKRDVIQDIGIDDSIAGAVQRELERWQGIDESAPEALEILTEYFSNVGQGYQPNVAWSGVLIQTALRKSNLPDDALYPTAAHYYYAAKGIGREGQPGKYATFRPKDVRVKKGDIILSNRSGSNVTYDELVRDPGNFKPTHGDIVVTDGVTPAKMIGGNVGNTVAMKNLWLDSKGRVTDPNIFAVMQYQT